jgi:hypothetical protein
MFFGTGFHDTAVDDILAKQDKFKPISLRDAQGGPSRDEMEAKARKEDKKKLDELNKKDAPKAIMQMNR